MIRLTNQNWWVRMAYTGRSARDIPRKTNICSLFWRGVGVLGAEILLAALAGYALAAGIVYYDVVLMGLGAVFLVCAIVGGVFFLGFLAIRGTQLGREGIYALSETVPAQAFKSWKEKHCALVRIEPTEREWT